jgi:Zn-dependent peptidase ImmA (M78 family)
MRQINVKGKRVSYVTIKGSKYRIIIDNKYEKKHGTSSDGHIEYETNSIYVNGCLDNKRRKEVLLHELLHGIIKECSIYQSLPRGVEEILVDNISSEFVRLFFNEKN